MEKTETAELIEFLSAVEGREFTTERLEAWYEIIGHLNFDEAKSALLDALREGEPRYLQPREISARVYRLREKQKQEAQKETTKQLANEDWKGSPMPKCSHGKGLLFCDPCCRNAAIQAGLINPR